MENKICKQCGVNFTVTDEDLAFLEKVSPEFNGKKYLIPAPKDCPECRAQRRFAFRNVRNVYRREVDLNGEIKPVISVYSPNNKHQVIHEDEYLSDGFEVMKYGREFDFSRPFFPQLQELHLAVPKAHAISDGTNENAEFINAANHIHNAYLVFSAMYCENVYYSDAIWKSNNCLDCLSVTGCEGCYECLDCADLYRSFYCQDCTNSRELMFGRNLQSCQNCFGCVGLRNKQYFVFNEARSKDEYEIFIKELNLTTARVNEYRDRLIKLYQSLPVKFAKQINVENSTGENLTNCKNCQDCFDINEGENLKFCRNLNGGNRNCQDICNFGTNIEWCYQASSVGRNVNHILFTVMCAYESNDIFYSMNCLNSNHDLFGCVGLKHKQYCVLNKQYSKEEYEKLVTRIIEHMQQSGEWGEFFPYDMSPFAYNESAAQENFPLSKTEAARLGADWQDADFGLKYEGPFYEVRDIKEYDPTFATALVGKAKENIEELLKGVIRCEVSGKPFRVISQEVAFCIDNGLPIPTKHPAVRHQERFARKQPRKLYHRQCMCEGKVSSFKFQGSSGGCEHEVRCPNEFETTYSPDREEKVYCENCYQKSIL